MSTSARTEGVGRSYPFGATAVQGSVNFSVFSRTPPASNYCSSIGGRCALASDPTRSSHEPNLSLLARLRTGLEAGADLRLSREGPREPGRGLRFDSTKVLLDPYGRASSFPGTTTAKRAKREGDNAAIAMKSVVIDPAHLRLGRRQTAATSRRAQRSSTRCTFAASRAIPTPASPKRRAAPTPG